MSASQPDATDAELVAFPDTPERRLRRALRALDQALAQQRSAVTALRGELAALGQAVAGLQGSTQGLRGALDGAAADCAKARAASLELMKTAEMMERRFS
jgi:transposase